MRMYDIIEKKKLGNELSTEEINFLIENYTNENIPDYQVSALLMAIYYKGLTRRETLDLTTAIIQSGEEMDLSSIEGIKVDKHSSGGVGDTTTLVVAPLVASLGIPVAKMSGRGLGHTGGTLDKLESIEGFNINLTTEEFINQVNNTKVSVIGQTKDITPADKKLYALRDVTCTVDNIGLIAASIMGKKIASGSNKIVLDVKCGTGAFFKNFDDAAELAKVMVNVGTDMGRETIAIITDMEQPLGYAIGNAIEVKEAMDVLNNKGPEDLRELCIHFASEMAHLGSDMSIEEAREKIIDVLSNKKAYHKFEEFIKAQGGDLSKGFKTSKFSKDIISDKEGYLKDIITNDIGNAAMILGAGREKKTDTLDMGSGIYFYKKIGDKISKGEVIGTVLTDKKESIEKAIELVLTSLTVSDTKVEKRKLIQGKVTKDGVFKY